MKGTKTRGFSAAGMDVDGRRLLEEASGASGVELVSRWRGVRLVKRPVEWFVNFRGGSWFGSYGNAQAVIRFSRYPAYRSGTIGFRLIKRKGGS